MIFQRRKYDQVTDLLHDTLHRLPIRHRVVKKLCIRSSTSAFTAWPRRTYWRCANQFLMSLVVAAYIPQPEVIWLSREPKRTTRFCSVRAYQLERTASIVP